VALGAALAQPLAALATSRHRCSATRKVGSWGRRGTIRKLKLVMDRRFGGPRFISRGFEREERNFGAGRREVRSGSIRGTAGFVRWIKIGGVGWCLG
jgi:hypothetical protein